MEHIESALGVYSSTGGFLLLLKSLFTIGVCPPTLGANWRLRTGCTPYLEYVTNLVLPRVTGCFKSLPPLPFRTAQDKLTVTALALEVVEAVLTRYCVLSHSAPGFKTVSERHRENLSTAQKQLGHAHLADAVVVEPFSEDGKLQSTYNDYGMAVAQHGSKSPNAFDRTYMSAETPGSLSASGGMDDTRMRGVPPVKSPGLTILAGLLSSVDSTLFDSIVAVLTALSAADGDSTDRFALAYSLYVATPPSLSSAKEGSSTSTTSYSHHTALEAIRPTSSAPTSREAMEWKERSTLSALRLLCAVIAREEALGKAIAMPGRLSLVPILRFHQKAHVASQLKVLDLQFLQLSQQIQAADIKSSIVSALTDCVAFRGIDDTRSVNISCAATVIVFYVERSLGSRKTFDLLCRPRDGRCFRLARAFGSQLVTCADNQSRRKRF
jgi:hypothetical protein